MSAVFSEELWEMVSRVPFRTSTTAASFPVYNAPRSEEDKERIRKAQYHLTPHPPYSSDISPRDYHTIKS